MARRKLVNGKWVTLLKKEKERFICRVGRKVEVSFEEEHLRKVWYPATIVEDLGNNLFLVEYNCSGSNGESELKRVSIDHLHIRPPVPFSDLETFYLLEKVDAFYDFGWWSGVITKQLADSRYIVYFKHTNNVKEFSHLELRPRVDWKDDFWFTTDQFPVSNDAVHDELRETATLDHTNLTGDTPTSIDKQTYSVTRSMKRLKPTNVGGSDKLKPCKKLKAGIASHDPDLSNKGPSNEVNDQSVGQTVEKTKRLLRGKKTLAKQDKSVDLKRPMITSARKKRKLSVNSRGLKALLKAAGDLALTTTPNTVEGKHVSEDIPSVVIGLRCKALTVPQSKKSKQLLSKSPENVGEPEALQSSVPLASKTTENQDKETDGDTSTKKKWGKTFRRQPTNLKASLALTVQQEKSNTTVTGKRGRRRMVSLDIEPSPRDLQDSSRQLENGNSDIVEKSLDLVSENQPVSSWLVASLEYAGKKPPGNSNIPPAQTNGNDQILSFEKRSSFWETIESMEAFHLFPQNPHFLPLDSLNESARERHAIYKMVDFSCVFMDMCHLQLDHPRTDIEDKLETLLELETHGFDVSLLKNRMVEMLYWKDKREALEIGSKEPEGNLEIERVKVQERDREIVLLDSQIDELRDKRERLAKENEESKLRIAGWEEKVGENEEAKRECDRKIYELTTAPF